MNCPICGETSFQKIDIIDRDNCDSGDGWSNNTTLQIRGQIEEFPEGQGVFDGASTYRSKYLWYAVSKVCLSCGYIVSFLPFEQLRKKMKLESEEKSEEEKAKEEKKAFYDAFAVHFARED